MQPNFRKLFLLLTGFFGLVFPGCKSSKQAYYFNNKYEAYAPAFKEPGAVRNVETKTNLTPETAAFSTPKVPEAASGFSDVITADSNPENKITPSTPSISTIRPNQLLTEKGIERLSKKQAKLQKQKAADPGPNAITAALVWLLLALLAVVAILIGITSGWYVWYLIALGLFYLAFYFDDLINNSGNYGVSALEYLKAIFVTAIIIAVLAFGIHLLLISPPIYSIITLGALILALFILKIIKYYRKKNNAARK